MTDVDQTQIAGSQPQGGPVDLYQFAGIQPGSASAQAPVDLLALLNGTSVSAAPPNQTNILDDALHSATGGLVDKVDAAAQATGLLPSWLGGSGVPGDTYGDRYHKDLTNIRANYGDFEAAHPDQAYAAKAAGVIGPMMVLGPEATAPKTMGAAALDSAKTGAVMGAGYGFGGTDDSSLKQDVAATGLGALAGGAAGSVLPVGVGIAKTPFRLTKGMTNVFSKEGVNTAAGNILNEATTGALKFDAPPISGMQLTAGQSSNDPGLLWLERSVNQGTPRAAELSSQSSVANNSAIRSSIVDLGAGGSDPSQAMSDALDAAYAKRKAANAALWKSADTTNTGGVSGSQFNAYMSKYVAGLPIADQAAVPQSVTDIMGKMADAKTQNLSDVQSVRSMLSSQATMASRNGDANTARILGGMADQVGNFVDMKAANLGQTLPLYNQARADTRDMKMTFQQPPAVRAALGVDMYGADKVPVSATADHFITTGKGAPEKFQSYLNAISTKDPQTGKITYDPAGLQAAQDAFSQKFLAQVSNAGTDANGQPLISPAKMQSFLNNYSHVINSPAFSPAQRDLISRIGRATQMANRSVASRPPGGGSDTFQKLQGDKFIDVLIGPGASKLINMAGTVGGAVGGYLSEGKLGAAAGLFGGEKVANAITSQLQAPREKVVQLITEAMHDPDMAQALMQKASGGNLKLLKPATRTKMLGILGARATAPLTATLTQ